MIYSASLKYCLGLVASVIVICGYVAVAEQAEPLRARRVAIIGEFIRRQSDASAKKLGAGAAGSSTAYHLRKFASEENLAIDITIFEQSDYIGGRTTTVQAYGDSEPVELGGSIFVNVNYILQNASVEFGLQRVQSESVDDEYLGIWDGDSFVFTQQEAEEGWKGYWNIGRLLVSALVNARRTWLMRIVEVWTGADSYSATDAQHGGQVSQALRTSLLPLPVHHGESNGSRTRRYCQPDGTTASRCEWGRCCCRYL